MTEIERLANQLWSLADRHQRSGAHVPPGLYRISELPDQSEDWHESRRQIREFGEKIHAMGPDMMVDVFDKLVEMHGWRAVRGVSSAWTGVGGWSA